MKQTVNSLVLAHLVSCANKAIAEREVTYTDGEYTAKHLATCQPAPAWDGKSDETIVVIVNGKHTSFRWSKVFESICDFGGENEVFKFATEKKNVTLIAPKSATPKVETPKEEASKTKAPKAEAKPEKPSAPKAKAKPKSKAKSASEVEESHAICGPCIEFNKSTPVIETVRMSSEFSNLPTLYYNFDKEKNVSRIYKLRDPNSQVLHMVGAISGNASDAERQSYVAGLDKYKVIAEQGIEAAIENGLLKDMPHFKE